MRRARIAGSGATLLLVVTVAWCAYRPGASVREHEAPGRAGSTAAEAPPASVPDPPGAAQRDPRASLVRAFETLKTTYPYRSTDTSVVTLKVGPSAAPTVRVTERAARDRMRVTWHRGSQSGAVLLWGGRAYVNTQGEWRAVDKPPGDESDVPGGQVGANDLLDVHLTGTEPLDGTPAYAYTFRFKWTALALSFDGTGKAWVGIDDGLLRRVDVDAGAFGFDMHSRVVYEYNVDLKIEAPAL